MATETKPQATGAAAEESAQANAREVFRLNATYLVARTARRVHGGYKSDVEREPANGPLHL